MSTITSPYRRSLLTHRPEGIQTTASKSEPSPGPLHAAVASDAGYMITCAVTGGSRNIHLPYPEGLTWSAACAGSPSAASPPAITHPYTG